MNKPAAIAAQLVDIRNIGTHKSLRLTIHVPEEYALETINTFGWATGSNPIPVALAKLDLDNTNISHPKDQPKQLVSPDQHNATPDSVTEAVPGRARIKWRIKWQDKPLASQAAIRCSDVAYWRFLGWYMKRNNGLPGVVVTDEEGATKLLKAILGIASRVELIPGTDAGIRWDCLEAEYSIWLRSPEMVA